MQRGRRVTENNGHPHPRSAPERDPGAGALTSDRRQEQWETVRWAAEALRTFASPPPLYPGTVKTEHGSDEHKTQAQAQPTSLSSETPGQGSTAPEAPASPRASRVQAPTAAVPGSSGNQNPQKWGIQATKTRHEVALDLAESSAQRHPAAKRGSPARSQRQTGLSQSSLPRGPSISDKWKLSMHFTASPRRTLLQ